jgi:hypothetical protein
MDLIPYGAAAIPIGALEEAFRAARAAVASTVVEVSAVEEAVVAEGMAAN